MSDKKDFYIGWKEEMPATQKRFLKRFISAIFILIPLLVFAVVFVQNPFNAHQFEFGNVKEISGVYHETPIPLIIADSDKIPEGFSNTVLLVGYGKFGANGIIKEIEEKVGQLNGKKITIKGTLIYGSGKTLLELTEEENSLVRIHRDPIRPKKELQPKIQVSMVGEILDPKCYFGVMKPGEGKVHKSCAIRCISGGIPPVFRSQGDLVDSEVYYILRGKNGGDISKEILNFVGEQIEIFGDHREEHGWNVLYADINSIK